MAGNVPSAEKNTVMDVVCARGVRPEEAVATRVYKGETYFFCCPGCAEAFDRNPEAYIGEEVIRAYRVEDRVTMGPDPARIAEAEANAQRYGADMRAAEERARSARDRVGRLRRELDEARAAAARRREELAALGRRQEELRAVPETTRVADLEARVARERQEYEAAQRALLEARNRYEAFLLQRRAEVSSLEERERMLQAALQSEAERARDLESRMIDYDRLRMDLDDARAKLGERRQELEMLARREAELRALPSTTDIAAIEQRIQQSKACLEETERLLERSRRGQVEFGATETRVSDLEHKLSQARTDFEQAQHQLEEARRRVQSVQTVRPPDIADLERRRRAVEADVSSLELRMRDLESRFAQYDRLRRELEDARARMTQHRGEFEATGKRADEIRAAVAAEEARFTDLQRQVQRERVELEEAQRALAEDRMRTEQMLRRRRAEVESLRQRQARLAGPEMSEQRARELEARIAALEDEAREADRRVSELREAERHAQAQLDRIRRESHEVVRVGLPAAEGEEVAEFYRTERVPMRER